MNWKDQPVVIEDPNPCLWERVATNGFLSRRVATSPDYGGAIGGLLMNLIYKNTKKLIIKLKF